MLKMIGTDIVIGSFFTKTIAWRPKKCPCLSALAVVSKIIGNTKTLTAVWFLSQIKHVFQIIFPTLVNLFRNSPFYAGSINTSPAQK